ncbi:iron ABC transporter permease [Glycomyces sp. YM15]|uniref:ABC transporter permease n=1 Tax=Glycomyces sp. YM15 TaxID=2800446 RepID=UPI0019658C9A|nr:iron ABC transporter permease [Glycomyces sp. YM15]
MTSTAHRDRAATSPPGRALLRRAGSAAAWLWCLPAVAAALVPLVYLTWRTAEAGGAAVLEQLARPRLAQMTLNTLLLSGAVTISCLVIGTTTAYLVSRTDLRARTAVHLAASLPLAVPTYVAAFAWRAAFPDADGFWISALVLTVSSFPYVHLPVAAALMRTDPALEEQSRILGDGPWRTFFKVTLRQIAPAAVAGALLCALYVFHDFGAVSILRYETFTTAIYSAWKLGFDRTGALVLSTALAALALVLLTAEWAAAAPGRRARRDSASGREPTRLRLRRTAPLAYLALAGLTALSLGVPAWSLVRWTLDGVSTADPAEVWAAAWTSLSLSAAAAALTVALVVPVGLYAARHRSVLAAATERVVYLGYALPGVVIGLSLVFLAINVDWIYERFYQSAPLLVFGYAVMLLPLGAGAVKASAAQASPQLGQVAASLGAGPVRRLATITLPLTAPGIAAGAALVFLTAMKELPATLLLRPAGTETLATRLWTYTDIAAFSAAAPYATLIVVVSAVPIWLLGRRIGRLRP